MNVLQSETIFGVCDGRQVGSLKDLALTIDSMNEETFRFHVSDEKNDFAAWINSMGAGDLAQKLGPVKDRAATTYEIMKFVLQNI